MQKENRKQNLSNADMWRSTADRLPCLQDPPVDGSNAAESRGGAWHYAFIFFLCPIYYFWSTYTADWEWKIKVTDHSMSQLEKSQAAFSSGTSFYGWRNWVRESKNVLFNPRLLNWCWKLGVSSDLSILYFLP